ncbi:MAG: LysR family transcriptional regulator, partial [Sinobacteraceae bacterium]|nr:LysR family transcriptional regulator [Nevskiaceae bacterium]
VNCGGFSAAEIDLGIGRSTISTHICELEARLGTRLCQRGRGGFALTARGKKIYEASRGLMKSLDDFRNEVNADDAMTGEINIGVVDNIIWDRELRLREVFRDFSGMASNIDLTLYVLSPDEIERRLLDERLDVGIAPVMHEVAGLSYTYLFDEINNLYCGRGHELFNRPDAEISTADLVKSQYVKKGYAVNSNLQQANAAMGKRVIGYHVEAFALLILSGCYIGFLPEHYASVWESTGEMRRLLPKRYEAVVSFASMTARNRPHSKALDGFLTCLHKAATNRAPANGTDSRAPKERARTPAAFAQDRSVTPAAAS